LNLEDSQSIADLIQAVCRAGAMRGPKRLAATGAPARIEAHATLILALLDETPDMTQ
jgi:hypothetical protein